MSHPVQLSDQLYAEARSHATVNHRSVPKQIEHWSRIGKIAEENPDLPYEFIKGILLSREEIARGEFSEYEFG